MVRVGLIPALGAMPSISVLDTSNFSQAAALYNECGYRGGIADTDTAIAAWAGRSVVAAVRLCQEGGVTVLRGMQVLPAYQRQGIGSKLLLACVPYLNLGTSYCLPYAHLTAFYGAVGFVTVGVSELPKFLQDRQSGYASSGLGTIAMSRMAGELTRQVQHP